MELLLGFSPFIVFALIATHLSPSVGLAVGAIIAIALVVRTYLRLQAFRILEVGAAMLMTVLAVFTLSSGTEPSILTVRLLVDSGMLVIVLLSLVLRMPFTIQYARETVDPEYWNTPAFVGRNYQITGVWAGIFAFLVCVEAAMLFNPSIPQHLGFAAIIVALILGFRYTAKAGKSGVAA